MSIFKCLILFVAVFGIHSNTFAYSECEHILDKMVGGRFLIKERLPSGEIRESGTVSIDLDRVFQSGATLYVNNNSDLPVLTGEDPYLVFGTQGRRNDCKLVSNGSHEARITATIKIGPQGRFIVKDKKAGRTFIMRKYWL